MVTYFVDRRPTKVHRFCVCAGQTVSVLVEQHGSRVWVRVEWGGGGGGQASSFSATVFSCALFIYLGRRVHPPCRVCYLFSLWVRAPIQSTLSAVTVLHRTHTHTLIGTYIAYWDACAPPAACKASSCSTYTHSFPLPTPISSPLNGPRGPELSLRLSRTFSSSCCLFESLLSIYESPHLLRVHVLITLSLPISFPSLYLKRLPPGERRKKERGSPNPGPGARNFPIWISLQTN